MKIDVLDELRHIEHSLSLAFRGIGIMYLMRRERRASFKPGSDNTEISVDLDMPIDAFKAKHGLLTPGQAESPPE